MDFRCPKNHLEKIAVGEYSKNMCMCLCFFRERRTCRTRNLKKCVSSSRHLLFQQFSPCSDVLAFGGEISCPDFLTSLRRVNCHHHHHHHHHPATYITMEKPCFGPGNLFASHMNPSLPVAILQSYLGSWIAVRFWPAFPTVVSSRGCGGSSAGLLLLLLSYGSPSCCCRGCAWHTSFKPSSP